MQQIRFTNILLIAGFIAFAVICQMRKKDAIVINETDYAEIKHIIALAYLPTDTIDLGSHKRFWEIVDKYGGNPSNIDNLGSKESELKLIDENSPYVRLFYEDALIALKQGESYESDKRKQLDTTLTAKSRQEFAELMMKIISKQPISYKDTEIVMDEQAVNRVLENLDKGIMVTKQKLDILYNRNYFKKNKTNA